MVLMTTGAVGNRKTNQKQVIPERQRSLAQNIETDFVGIVDIAEPGGWEYNLTYFISPTLTSSNSQNTSVLDLFHKLKEDPRYSFNMLIDITAVDWLDRRKHRFEVVYQLLSLTHLHRLTLKISVSEDHPIVDSVRSIWPAANFLEREVWDMFGIEFRGHGDLRRILLYDEFVGHPLRKDYPIRKKQPRIPLRFPELANTAEQMHRDELVKLPGRVAKEGLAKQETSAGSGGDS